MAAQYRALLVLSILLAPRPTIEASLDGQVRASPSTGALNNPVAPSDPAHASEETRGSDLEEALEKLAGGKMGVGGSEDAAQSAARRATATRSIWNGRPSATAGRHDAAAAAAAGAAAEADGSDLEAAELGYEVALLAEVGRLAAPDGSPDGVDADLDELDDDAELLDELERIEAALDRARDGEPAEAAVAAAPAAVADEEGREWAAAYDSRAANYDDLSTPSAEAASAMGSRTAARGDNDDDELYSLLERLVAAASASEAVEPESTSDSAHSVEEFGAIGRYDERRMFTNSGGRGKKEESASLESASSAMAPEQTVADASYVADRFGGLRDEALRRLAYASRQLATKYVTERLKARRLLAILKAVATPPAQSRQWSSSWRQRGYQ